MLRSLTDRDSAHPSLAYGLDDSLGVVSAFKVNQDGYLFSVGLHWNTSTLAYEVNTGGTATGAEVNVTNFPASQAVTGTFWQTTQPVSIASMPTTPVTGTFWQTTQPVSGPLTDTELRNADVKVTLDGETVSIANFPATQPISAVSLPLPSGAATEATLATLQSLIETLQELTARLAVLASWANSGVAGMRVVGVSMPSTAVTGPLTNAQLIAARPLVNMENLAAIQGNINNCTGA